MHLIKIELTNFQSHKSTTINLDGGFVCIAGKTRSGKSSVLRALNFLFNDVWSDSFIRTGEKSVKVSVTLDNNINVSREKGNGINKINVTYADGSTKEFNNFGIQAPIEVKKILGVTPLVVDSDYSENINVHMQDDPHFLISKSAPMKTKFINRLTRLHVIDAANREITKEQQDINKSISNQTIEINKLKQKVAEYDNLESKKNFYNELQKKIDLVTKAIESINLKYDKLYILATKSAEYYRKKVLYNKRKVLARKINGVSGLLSNYNKAIHILTLQAKLDHLIKVSNLRTQLINAYTQYKDILITVNQVNTLQSKYLQLTSLVKLNSEQLEMINYMKNNFKVCPTCKRPLWSDK